jgi:transketolase
MRSVVALLPRLDADGVNVKIVCVTSPELFERQPRDYRSGVITPGDQADSTVVTTQARWLMQRFLLNPLAEEYALSSDHDDSWRTGGSLEEVIDEAHLSPEWVMKGIRRFVDERPERLRRLREQFDTL